jgi:ABC-type Zn uptake system ZnuABC Zn-binding protein ZnuA
LLKKFDMFAKFIGKLGFVLVISIIAACNGSNQGAGEDSVNDSHEGGLVEMQAISLAEGEKIRVVVTTNILGDIVSQIGGDQIEMTVLMGIGEDPHSYVPIPSDFAAIHDAHVIFAVGAGLEFELEEIFSNAGGEAPKIEVSTGINLRMEDDEDHRSESGIDPHMWFSVPNVVIWAQNIQETLIKLDNQNGAYYKQNALEYIQELEQLDAWIFEQISQVPDENRLLVSNHPVFGYFADRYGFEQTGAVYPISPSSEPSAQDIAILEDVIREFDIPAIFTESTVNPKLAEQVANDTDVQLVRLFTGSLGEPGSGVESYLELIRFDVNAIVDSLK